MTARRQLVLNAFFTAMSALEDGTDPVTVKRRRRRPFTKTDLPAISIKGGGQRPVNESTEDAHYAMDIRVEAYTSVQDEDADLDAAISELYARIVETALADHTLGGVAIDVQEGEMEDPVDDDAEGSAPASSFEIIFIVEFFTYPGQPRLPA